MIKFSIGGKSLNPVSMKDAVMAAVLQGIRDQLTEKIGAIHDPNTGEFPTVIVRGDSLDNIKLHIERSPELIALVRERLGMSAEDDEQAADSSGEPHVFLSYTSDDSEKAKQIAEVLNESGINVWWDKWCIGAGDSLRQKIDEGISGCTHFLVLLTPRSIKKPWVNQEMDAGLVRKLNDQCKFLPVRSDLSASGLPPLLSGMHSPAIDTPDDLTQLVNDIYGVTRKPPKGAAPPAVQRATETSTGYSAAATSIARLFVERSEHALFADPQFDTESLAKEVGLSTEDTEDALFELSSFVKTSGDHVLVEGALFPEFDRYWKPWNPADDALRLAADIVNDPDFPDRGEKIASRYGWNARRLNPAVEYLFERGLLLDYRGIGTAPWSMHRIVGKPQEMRRFLKSRA